MQLDYIALDRLAVSKTNMRHGAKAPDVSDILPTIRKRGVIQPLLVRPGSESGQYEIIAGRRRFTTACLVAQDLREAGGERGDALDSLHIDPLPCAILDADDDAIAIEASTIENMARLDADEVTQWESFVRLVKQGRDVADIAATNRVPVPPAPSATASCFQRAGGCLFGIEKRPGRWNTCGVSLSACMTEGVP